MNKKRVCILTSVHFNNDNRVYYKEVFSLRNLGYEVVYIAPDQSERFEDNIHYVNVDKPSQFTKRLFSFYKVYRLAKKQNCSVYHFQDPELIPTGLLLKWLTQSKVVYDVHEDYPNQMLTKYYLKKWERKFFYHIVKFFEFISDKCFDAIVVADNFVYKNFNPSKTVILYNFPSLKLMRETEQQLDNSGKKEYDIIFPGTLSKFTAEMIVNIVKEASNRGYALKCLLISPFDFKGGKQWIIDRTKELSIDGQFTLMDRVPPYEVPKYLKLTRIGLIPLPDTLKMRSNIPTKMFEYMFNRLPVITGELPPSVQFLAKDPFGYLVDPNSYMEYTDRIIELLNDENKALQMGSLGRRLVEEKYNWENEEIKMNELYEKLCQ